MNFWRGLLCCALFSVIFIPEFTRDGSGNSCSPLYAKAVGGFRFVDLAIFLLVFCHIAILGCSRGKTIRFPRTLAFPGLAFLGCVGLAMAYGNAHGGSNFFFDWRGLALGIGLYFVWSFWIQRPNEFDFALRFFALYMAVRIALLYALYAVGYRDTLLGVSIPIFDGPALSCIVFTGLLAFGYQEAAKRRIEKLLWSGLAAAAYVIVLLCFRRTYWGELGVGTFILLLLRKRHRLRSVVFAAATLCVATAVLGNSFSSRIQSLDVTSADTEFSADNADHLLDLADAWDQVRQSPVMGIGLGTSYATWRIKNWKTESVMVHNAPLHVWLKYGLAGLACYLWFHIALLRWLYRRTRQSAPNDAFLSAAFAYLTAQFAVTLGFAPWPYSELQLTTLMSFLLAGAVISGRKQYESIPSVLTYEYPNSVRRYSLT
ncbi:MAG: O-antigen ligase family protein [Candidatus Korobacteraceae bacterium]